MKRALLQGIERIGLLRLAERLGSERPGLFKVLLYHRIGERDGSDEVLDPYGLSATPEEFAAHMRFIARRHRPISAAELVAALGGEAELAPGAVLVTFDDGYRSFMDHAWPIARKWGVPLTLFVVTGHVGYTGGGFWWDEVYRAVATTPAGYVTAPELGALPLVTAAQRRAAWERIAQHLKRLPRAEMLETVTYLRSILGGQQGERRERVVLNWDELRRLAAEGVAVASHTRTHPVLSRVSLTEAREEITGAQEDLRRELGSPCPLLAYPHGKTGDFTPEVARLAAEAGLTAAFTTEEGHNVVGKTPPFSLHRMEISDQRTVSGLRLRLSPLYPIWLKGRKLKDGLRGRRSLR